MKTIREFLNDWMNKIINLTTGTSRSEHVKSIEDIESECPIVAKKIREKFAVEEMDVTKYQFMLMIVNGIDSETPEFYLKVDSEAWLPNTFIFNSAEWVKPKKKLVVLTGSGISRESGIPTFRDSADGLWENYDLNVVCTAQAMKRNPELIHDFYNKFRNDYKDAQPNKAHKILSDLEKDYDVQIITQNVDNLHEKAGSTNVLHLHGEIMKCRDKGNTNYIFDIPQDENGNYNTYHKMTIDGHPIRPHIVFFGEDVPNLPKAASIVKKADILVIVGTSFNVYPAAGLIDEAQYGIPIYYIDPYPAPIDKGMYSDVKIIEKVATEGMEELVNELNNLDKPVEIGETLTETLSNIRERFNLYTDSIKITEGNTVCFDDINLDYKDLIVEAMEKHNYTLVTGVKNYDNNGLIFKLDNNKR